MLNSITLVGRAGQDAEIKYFDSGKSKATFNLAVDRPGKKSEAVTDWFRVEVWGKAAEVAVEYVKKGKQVGVVGRMEIQLWTDKDGTKRKDPVVQVSELRLMGGKNDERPAPAPPDFDDAPNW